MRCFFNWSSKKNNSSPHVSGGGGGQPLNPLVFNARVNGQTRSNVWLPGPSIVRCINIVIDESQVEGNGECLCQFGFLTFRPLSRLSSSSALILIIPVKPQTAPCTLLRFSAAAAYRLCHSLWQGRQEAQHSFILHKGRPVQLDKYYFLLLTAPPVKLVLYYFSLFLLSYCLFPLIIMLPLRQCLRKGLTWRKKSRD